MLLNKIILIGIFFMCIGSISAWGDETAPLDNETVNIGLNPALNESAANNPYPYGINNDIMESPLTKGSYLSNDPITLCTSYMLYKQVWDGSSYIQIEECNITLTECVDLIYNPESEAYELPDNWADVTTNGFLVSRYFQNLINSDSQYCSQWNSSDESDFPDVFYTSVVVDYGYGTDTGFMYTSLDDDDIESFSDDDIDYGFMDSGRGSDAGSGSIYEGINLYGNTEGGSSAQGMGDAFGNLFYLIIPILFILCVLKFVFGLV